MSAEELSRILVWVLGAFATGFGLPTPEALFALVQPEIVGAVLIVLAAVWRYLRPPVVNASGA